ncbi:ABC transporter [Monaibacterium marinum]|uniref:ABC transporter n=1 Tax=Pontivivens marinum TaxID=1690039 RepID=A0A2C9CQF2_9RHOB|nr:ATP-binding cassette domain-containing protein [Monaibacterium marinum]SOH93586.1 ABC transporter [Monaibacterium marinum]
MSMLQVKAQIERNGYTLALDFASDAQITMLQGPSGAGKTLTLHLIAGLLSAPNAQVILDGCDLSAVPAQDRGFSMAFQEPRLFPHLSVRRNILYARRNKGALPALAQALDITELLDRRPADLSGGQAQRVSLARALLADSALTLLDEPFTGLDIARRDAVISLLANSNRRVVLVSHDPDDAIRLNAKIVHVSNGVAR